MSDPRTFRRKHRAAKVSLCCLSKPTFHCAVIPPDAFPFVPFRLPCDCRAKSPLTRRGMKSGLLHLFRRCRTRSNHRHWRLPQNQSIAGIQVVWSWLGLWLKLTVALACVVSVTFVSSVLARPRNSNSPCAFNNITILRKSHLPSSEKAYMAVTLDHSLGDSLFKFAALMSIAAKVKRKFAFSKDRVNPVADVFDVTFAKKLNTVCWKNIQEHIGPEKHGVFKSNSSVDVVLKGNFQSWRYFDPYSKLVRTELRFRRFVFQEAHDVITNHIGKSFRKTPLVGFHIVTRKLRHLPPSQKFDSIGLTSRTVTSEYVVFPPLNYVMRAMDHMRMKFGKVSVSYVLIKNTMFSDVSTFFFLRFQSLTGKSIR